MENAFKILMLTLALAMYSSAMNCNMAYAREKSYINGIDPNYPPFTYITEEGAPDGLEVASLNWIAKEMGFTITHQPIIWGGMVSALLDKKIDIISGSMSITPDRQKIITFSEPYWQSHKVYLTKNNSTLDINTIQNTKIRLGTKRGTNNADTAQKNIHDKGYAYSLRFYASISLAIEDLLHGCVDAVTLDCIAAENAIAEGKPLKIVGQNTSPDYVGVAMRHEDTELHAIINEGFKRLKATPCWEKLKETYIKGQ